MTANVELRSVSSEDDSFLFALYTAGRRNELEAIGWDEEQILAFCRMQFTAQSRHYRLLYPEATDQIVMVDNVAVGRLKLDETGEEILLIDIALTPAYQKKGIGTSLIENLKAAATAASKPVRLHALINSSAFRLYERLGFSRVADDGLYAEMEFRP